MWKTQAAPAFQKLRFMQNLFVNHDVARKFDDKFFQKKSRNQVPACYFC